MDGKGSEKKKDPKKAEERLSRYGDIDDENPFKPISAAEKKPRLEDDDAQASSKSD
jgi:hypothetical protein